MFDQYFYDISGGKKKGTRVREKEELAKLD